MRLLLAVLAVLLTASVSEAQNKNGPPGNFEIGVKLYEAGKYEQAAEAFKGAYELAPAPQILFAWAQAERMSGDCKTAIKLFELVLEGELPDANRKAVHTNIEKCKELLAEAEQSPTLPPPEQIQPEPQQTPPEPGPAVTASASASAETDGRPWYKDPVGGGLLASGALGVGIGVGFLVSASSADSAKDDATNYFDFESNRDRAESRGRIGVIATLSGTALIGAALAWYLLRGPGEEASAVSGWVGSDTAGVAVGGRF